MQQVNIIEEIKNKYNLNNTELGKKLNVDDVRIGRYIKNFGPADHRFLSKLLEAFPKLRAYWLLTGNGEMEWGGADDEFKFLCDHILKDKDIKKTLFHFLQWQLRNGKGNGDK
jgi:hypothetical protein